MHSAARWLTILLGFALVSCYQEILIEDAEVVSTFFDPAARHADIRTYALPDSVIQAGSGQTLLRTFDPRILDAVERELDGQGYRRVEDFAVETPDVVVIVYAVSADTWFPFAGFSWWTFYDWYPALKPWARPDFPITHGFTPEVIYTFGSGTLFLEMLDLRDLDEEDEGLPSIWMAAISGLLAEVPAGLDRRLDRDIAQAFAQSPYLRAGGLP